MRKMTALVIGNGSYEGAELKNPSNDAHDFTKAIEGFGFTVIKLLDANVEDIERAIDFFSDNLASNDVGLFYFAGHGMQIEGENYVTAINTDFKDEINAKYSSLPLNKLLEIMERSKETSTKLIILDACRNNPYVRAWNRSIGQRGLAQVYAPKGTLIAFATSPGEVASDGDGRNGAYTAALLSHINTPDIPVEEFFKRTRNTLSATTNGKQTSWEHTSLSGDFVFNVSLGQQITKYHTSTISDGLYILDPHKPGHSIIQSLKSHNWYTQNPVIAQITSELASKCDSDTLFVLGRNLYQAACGGARDSATFIINFQVRTADFATENKLSLLDGMLFEAFFNSKGEIRKSFKLSRFNDIFELQKYSELSPSFDFISDCLGSFPNKFYVIPGRARRAAVDITGTTNDKQETLIESVNFGGFNILRKDDEDRFAHLQAGKYEPTSFSRLKSRISEEMVIPLHLLDLNMTFDSQKVDRILFPYGYTLSKG